MNFLALILGATAVKNMTDYPSEIRTFRDQIPKNDRDAVMGQYKQLSGQAKTDFKTALRNADMAAASKILGQDLTKYNMAMKASSQAAGTQIPTQPESGTDIIERVNRILAVPTSIDPELVAEAAKRYEEAVPSGSSLSITEKAKRLVEIQG